MQLIYRSAIGQDSHRFPAAFIQEGTIESPLRIAGIDIPTAAKMEANSDGDVILHAVTNAISGITCQPVLGSRADTLCKQGHTDSRVYLDLALDDFKKLGHFSFVHLSISIEALRPKFSPYIDAMRESVAGLLGMPLNAVAITATTGEGLTGPGRGEGIEVLCILTVAEDRRFM